MKNKVFTLPLLICVFLAFNFCTGFKLVNNKDINTKYCGSGTFVSEQETINYSYKESTIYNIKSEVPNYIGQISNANCANVAGTILIAYYDRFCEELIPNYKTYVKIGSVIKYRASSFETETVMASLYDLMGTNVGASGTTYIGFQNGMKSYVNSKNYNYTIEDLGNLNLEKFKVSVENDRPVALFLSDFSFQSAGQDNGTVETINSKHCNVAHVVVGYGYKIDTYFNTNNQVIATRTYIKVASGIAEYGLTYLCLDGKSKIDKADSILIS